MSGSARRGLHSHWAGSRPAASAIGLLAEGWCSWLDSNQHWTRSERVASTELGYTSAVVQLGIGPSAGCLSGVPGQPARLAPWYRPRGSNSAVSVCKTDVVSRRLGRHDCGWGGRNRTSIQRAKAARPAVGRHPSRSGRNRTVAVRGYGPRRHLDRCGCRPGSRVRRLPAYEAGEPLLLHACGVRAESRTRDSELRRLAPAFRPDSHMAPTPGIEPGIQVS